MNKSVSVYIILYILSGAIVAIAVLVLFFPQKIGKPIIELPINALPLTNSGVTLSTNQNSAPVKPTTSSSSFTDLIQAADAYEAQGIYDKALTALTRASEKTTDIALVDQKRANIFMKMKNYEKAVEIYTALLQKNPQNVSMRIKTLDVKMHMMNEKNAEQAVNDISESLSSISEANVQKLYMQCILSAYKNSREETENYCNQVKEKAPGSKEASIAHALVDHYLVFSTFKDGSDGYLKALHAKSITEAGYSELAIPLLRQILLADKSYRDAWTLLGYNYLLIGKNSLGLASLESAYTLDTTKAYIQYLLGLAHDRRGNREKAISFYVLAVGNQFEKEIEVRSRLADLYVDNKNYDLALEQYTTVFTKTKPASPDAYVKPIWIYIETTKQPSKALELALTAEKQFPNNAVTDNLLGWAYTAAGKVKEARTALERGIKRDPSMAALYLNLGKLDQIEGKTDEAKVHYYAAYEKGKGTSIGDNAVKLYNDLSTQQVSL